jgi:hypothetical protein
MWLVLFSIVLGGLLYMTLFTDVMRKDINSLPLVFWLYVAALMVLSVGTLPVRWPFERSGPGGYKRYLMHLISGILFIVFSLLNFGRNGGDGSAVLMAVTGIMNVIFFLYAFLYKAKFGSLK